MPVDSCAKGKMGFMYLISVVPCKRTGASPSFRRGSFNLEVHTTINLKIAPTRDTKTDKSSNVFFPYKGRMSSTNCIKSGQ